MPKLALPPMQIDPAVLPPPIMTSEIGSFAWHTMAVRVPRIIEETIIQNDFPPAVRAALEALRHEILSGVAQPLVEDAPDRDLWQQASAPYLGRSWLDVPWYWAESYFYRRVLDATGYFGPGPWRSLDPFRVAKHADWQPDAAPRTVETLLADLPADPAARFARLLAASLWGNRIDLSLKHVAARYADTGGQAGGQESGLLVDDTMAVWNMLSVQPAVVSVVADNAGTELSMDLALIDQLLAGQLAQQVTLHLKPQPFFVSDATPADLDTALSALSAAGGRAAALAGRIRGHLAAGRLLLRTHWFYASSLFYFQLPADLRAGLGGNSLVVVKGDANYRRLLGDAHWPPSASFAAATSYFPAPLVALRTLKSDLITGLPPNLAERLDREDPQWRVDGSRGVIQARL